MKAPTPNRSQLVFATCCAIGVTILSFWLLRQIPLTSHSMLRKVVEHSMLLPIVIGTWIDGSHGHRFDLWFPPLVFAQWFVVGLGLSFLFSWRRSNDAD
jgi:hypothetical protein